jgi:cell division transport system permease protein
MSERSQEPIMPRDKSAAPLDLVIGVMAFLAALALGAALVANRAAESWRVGLASRITVQILPPENSHSLEAEVDAALRVLRAAPGIAHVEPISEKQTLDLVKPWLGSDPIVAELPLPRLIDAALVPGAPLDIDGLRAQLKAAAPDSVLDDHARWIARLKSLTRAISWSAYGVLALIALATAATVAFATRAGLEAHHKIVEVLHQMGARSGFIARAFQWHYFIAALATGAIGSALAALLFTLARGLEAAGVEPVPFLPPLDLMPSEIGLLVIVPIAAGLIALITAHVSVLAVLRRIY